MAQTTIKTEQIAADAITGAKIADNAIDSEHYTDGSIDTAHYADNSITGAELADNIAIAGTLDVAGAVVFNEGSADVDFRVESNGNANMLFVDGGNNRVGIGTASPSHRLTAKSDSNTNPAIKVEQTGSTDGWGFVPDNSNGNLEFSRIGGGTAGTHLAITNAGNVGIGTASPAAELHVSAATTTQIRCESTTNSSTSTLQLATNGSDWNLSAGGSAQGTYPNGFYIYDAGADATRMIIDSAGGLYLKGAGLAGHYSWAKQLTFTASETNNLILNLTGNVFGQLRIRMTGDYGNINAIGSFEKVWSIGVNSSNTSNYAVGGAGTTVFDSGSTSGVLTFGSMSKPSNTTVQIPITNGNGSYGCQCYVYVEITGDIGGIGSITFA